MRLLMNRFSLIAALLGLLVLSACGSVRPSTPEATGGITVYGTADAGVGKQRAPARD